MDTFKETYVKFLEEARKNNTPKKRSKEDIKAMKEIAEDEDALLDAMEEPIVDVSEKSVGF